MASAAFDHYLGTPVGAGGPVRSDMAESLAKATQVNATEELRSMLENGR